MEKSSLHLTPRFDMAYIRKSIKETIESRKSNPDKLTNNQVKATGKRLPSPKGK